MVNNERGQSLISKYVWMIETIHKAKKISFSEINRKWVQDIDISGGLDLPKRTFDNWRYAIQDIFGLIIENENKGEYRYYIMSDDDICKTSLRSWLYNTFCVSNVLANSFDVQPYCIKLFRQRWYMVARSTDAYYYEKGPRIYALDRIQSLHRKEETFKMADGWDAEAYFKGCFGIIADQTVDCQTIKLKVSTGQANYIRDLKLHESQQEIERHEEYSVFSYYLRPTFDFQQEILWNGENMEVMEPTWLRKEIAGKISRMWDKYKENDY